MTLKKQFYTLDEASAKIGCDVDTILQNAVNGQVKLSISNLGNVYKLVNAIPTDNSPAFDQVIDKTSRLLTLKANAIARIYSGQEVEIHSYLLTLDQTGYDIASIIEPTIDGAEVCFIYAKQNDSKMLTLSDLVITADELERITSTAKDDAPADTIKPTPQPNNDNLSNTAKKVIGLFMLGLMDKQPNGKYKNGDKPNKSNIRDYLLELAQTHKIDDYGLSKADERILSDALNYLEEQRK
jgi:hypothetical protein